MTHFDPNSQRDQAELRLAAAGLIKTLLVARHRAERSFLTAEIRDAWWKPAERDPFPTTRKTPIELLRDVQGKWKRFCERYSGPGDSLPSPSAGVSDVADAVRSAVLGFIDEEVLAKTIKKPNVRISTRVWTSLADWNALPQIRIQLDRLPRRGYSNEDGPFQPNGFRWRGVRATGCQPLPWRLISFLWIQRDKTAQLVDIEEEIGINSARYALPSVRTNANSFFKRNDLPWKISISCGRRLVSLLRTDLETVD